MDIYRLYHGKTMLWSLALTLLTGLATGCSDDDVPAGQGKENGSSPYLTLGPDNANMPSGGTIIAQYSDAPADADISKLVDADADTRYRTGHSSFCISWNGNSNVAVQSYSLASAAEAPEKDPKSWTLSGSQDNRTWTVLDTRENQTFDNRKQVKEFDIENTVAYRYYKLSVTDNQGSEETQIAEWTLSASTFHGNIDDLMEYASGHTFSSKTPMGTQHENDKIASASDLKWLEDATEEPETFANLQWKTFEVGSIYPFGSPKPADVNQHAIGDCCALAVMASLAHSYPAYIKEIIKENADRTYTVSLFDPKGNPVKVSVSNVFVADGDKLGAVSGKKDNVTWATILEKAIIKWLQVYKGSSDIGGIGTEYVSAIITGNGESFAFSPGRLGAEDLQRAVIVSLQQGKLVIGGFRDGGTPINGVYQTVNFHAYSFFPAAGSDVLFDMRNPWGVVPLISGGYSDGKEDGLLLIKDDNVVPPIIDIRVTHPGAAFGYGKPGKLGPYSPPAYAPAPLRIDFAHSRSINLNS